MAIPATIKVIERLLHPSTNSCDGKETTLRYYVLFFTGGGVLNTHVASLEEIKENEFNLNIPRCVDRFEEEQFIDLAGVNKLLEQDKREIAELEAKINEQLKIMGINV